MKTHKVRPVLVESKDIHSQLEIDDISIGKLSYEAKQYHCKHPQELILISLEDAQIEVGDTYYNLISSKIKICESDSVKQSLNICKSHAKKVIVRQSQLSPEYISKFIEQYNKGCVKDLKIKCGGSYEEFLDFCGKLGYDYDGAFGWYKRIDPGGNRPNTSTLEDLFNKYPKLTNGFVTIVEKEPISYTEEEVLSILDKYDEAKWGCPARKRMEEIIFWFNKNKKK